MRFFFVLKYFKCGDIMLKRPCIPVVLAFLLGNFAFVFNVNIVIILACVVAVCLWTIISGPKHKYLILGLIIMFLLGFLRMYMADCSREDTLIRYENRELDLTMTVTEFSSDGKAVVEFDDHGETVRVYLSLKSKEELFPGDIIKADVTLKEPYTSKVSVSDFATSLASENVFLYGYASEAETVGRADGFMGGVYSVRRYIDKVGEKFFEGDNRALFNAMVLGDKRLMSEELTALLRSAGISHIAVVSGMHLSVMITVLMMLLGSVFGKGGRSRIILIAGALVVTVVTGAGASAVRACIMCLICQGAFLFRRENDPLSALAVTVFVLIGINPYMIFNIGFILSVLSVLGIVLFAVPLEEKFPKRLQGTVGKVVAVTVSAQLTVVPAVLWFLGTASPYSIFANIAVTSFSSVIIIVGMFFPIFALVPLLAQVSAFLIKIASQWVVIVCNIIQELPGALAEVPGISLFFVCAWILSLILFSKRDKPRGFRVTAVLSVVAVLLSGAVFSEFEEGQIRMEFVSYGKNSMTTIACPDDINILVGCPDYSDALTLLEANQGSSYTYTVVWNPNDTGVVKLASTKASGTVVICGEAFSDEEISALKKDLSSCDTEAVVLNSGESFYGENVSIRFITTDVWEKEIVVPEIEYKGKSISLLQHLDTNCMEALMENNVCFNSDYIRLPDMLQGTDTDFGGLYTGTVIEDKSKFFVNLY